MRKPWIVFVLLWAIGAVPAEATQRSRRYSDMKMLEASLGGLKESYEAVAERNDRLLSDIAAYAQNIELLREEFKQLNEAKASLLEGRLPEKGAHPDEKSETSLRSAIERLSGDLDSLSQDKIEKAFHSRQDALGSSIHKNKEDVKSKEADLNKMNRQYEKPLKKVDSLKAEQVRLKLKVEELQDKLKKNLGGSGKPGQVSTGTNQKNEARLTQLNSEIVRLRLQQQKLTHEILENVHPEVSFGDPGHEATLWERRLHALKEENAILRKELMTIRGF